jgi:hypothetical protein
MLGWGVLVILGSSVAVAALVGSGALRVRRYSAVHVDGRLAVAGRGLFFSRTPVAAAAAPLSPGVGGPRRLGRAAARGRRA